MIEIYKVNESYFRLDGDQDYLKLIGNHYSFLSPGYKFSPSYKNKTPDGRRMWNGKVKLFKLTDKLFPAGLIQSLVEYLKEKGIYYNFNFNTSYMANKFSDGFFEKFYENIFVNSNFWPRDYQDEGIRSALINKRGVIEHATGSGKSLDIYCVVRYLLTIGKRICLIVPNIMLVEQMKREFIEYGWDDVDNYLSIMYYDHVPDIEKPMLISTFQSLGRQSDSMIMSYNAVIIDEVHGAKSKTIKEILSKMVNADYRIGFTGSLDDEEDPEKLIDIYTIIGYVGETIHTKTSKELIDEGYLSDVNVINMIIKYPDSVCKKNRYRPYQEEVDTIINYMGRNYILDVILKSIGKDKNTLILVSLIKHMKKVREYLKKFENEFDIRVIHGKIKSSERIKIQLDTENKSNMIILATYGTMSTGVNIKKLHNVVLFSSYKSKIKVIQSIGRGLRKHETKDVMNLFDIIDDMRWVKSTGTIGENNSWKQFQHRMNHYKSQQYDIISRNYDMLQLPNLINNT